MKECVTCEVTKPFDQFRLINRKKGARYRADCKDCENAARRAYRATNKGKRTRYLLNVWTEYGVTPEQFEALVLHSEGRCAICNRELRKFHLDHDHETGAVRELICPRCNLVVGMVETSFPIIKLAIAYIRKHRLRRSPARG